jgi:CHAD domain-containing protein
MLDSTRPAPADPWVSTWAGEIPRVLALLTSALQAGRLTEPVLHKSRRELKRLRSLLRLSPRSCAYLAEETREITGELRRRLGASRDATVMLTTLSELADELGDAEARIKPVLSAHQRAVTNRLDRSSRRGDRDRIARLGAIWRGRSVQGDISDLRRQVVKTYRSARSRAKALGEGQEAALHPLRKATVDHQNHLAFFAADPKTPLARRHAKVKRLRDKLGLCHDLEVLRDFVRNRADISAGDLIRLEEVLAERHRRLVRKSIKLASSLLRDGPRDFARWLKSEVAERRGSEDLDLALEP